LIDDYAANHDTFKEYTRAPFNLKNYSSLSHYFRKFKSYAVGHQDISEEGDVTATSGTSIILYHFDVLHAHFQLLFEISTVVDAFCGEGNELYPRLRTLLTGIAECVGRIKPGVDPLLDINGYFDLLDSLQQVENDDQFKCRQFLRNKVEDLILDTVTVNPTVVEFKKQFMVGGGKGDATDKGKFKYYDTLYNNTYTFSMYLFEKYPYLLPMYYAHLNNIPITLRNTRINTLLKQFDAAKFIDHSSQFLSAYKRTEHITNTKTLLNHISRSDVHELPSRHIFTQKELSRALALTFARRKKVGLIKPSPKKVKVAGGSKAKPKSKSNAGSRGK
jgi:hypothetical protein